MSKSKVELRDVCTVLQIFRNFLLGRKHLTTLRFEEHVAPRTQPQPVLPDGPCHKASDNFYFKRDARIEVEPPIDVIATKLLETSEKKDALTAAARRLPTPGNIYQWDHHVYYVKK